MLFKTLWLVLLSTTSCSDSFIARELLVCIVLCVALPPPPSPRCWVHIEATGRQAAQLCVWPPMPDMITSVKPTVSSPAMLTHSKVGYTEQITCKQHASIIMHPQSAKG